LEKIALDFDSVLSDTMIAWTDKHNLLHGTNFSKSDIRSWKFWEDLKVEVKIMKNCFQESWKDWKNLPATESELDKKVRKLSEFGIVDVVTNVDEDHLGYIRSWLENGNIEVNEVKHAGGEKIHLSYNLFIDDAPDLAKEAKKLQKNCFVYNQDWNVHIENSKTVSRIHSLTDAIDKISEKGL